MGKILKSVLFFIPGYIVESLWFELRSFLGRLFTGKLKLDRTLTNYLNLGCGPVIAKGFINLDFFFVPKIDYGADLRFPLKIESESIDGIICEHTLEHILYNDVDNLLGECHRIMKPGAVIRIILPDVSIFIRNYAEGNKAWFDEWERIFFITSPDPQRSKRRLFSPLQAISFVTQEYGHISAWDFDTLKAYLEKNGFNNVQKVAYRQGSNSKLLIDRDSEGRRYVSMHVEATK